MARLWTDLVDPETLTGDVAYNLTIVPEERLEEARGLALAIGLVVADSFILPVRDARPNLLFGSGQVENIAIACEQHEAELVVVDGALTPIQQRNLEDRLKRKVIDDRYGPIIEALNAGHDRIDFRAQITYENGQTGSLDRVLRLSDVKGAA